MRDTPSASPDLAKPPTVCHPVARTRWITADRTLTEQGPLRRDLPRGVVPRPLPFTEQKGTDMVPVPAQTCPPPGGPHTDMDRSEEVSRFHRPEHTGRSPADRPG
jgi:hypothetical protein